MSSVGLHLSTKQDCTNTVSQCDIQLTYLKQEYDNITDQLEEAKKNNNNENNSQNNVNRNSSSQYGSNGYGASGASIFGGGTNGYGLSGNYGNNMNDMIQELADQQTQIQQEMDTLKAKRESADQQSKQEDSAIKSAISDSTAKYGFGGQG